MHRIKQPHRALRPFVVPALLLIAWEAASMTHFVSQNLMPSPVAVLRRVWVELYGDGLATDIGMSLLRNLAGFLIGATTGTLLGLVLGLSRRSERLFGPLFMGYRQIALFAWVPLLSMWFGGAEEGKIAFISVAALAPAAINTWRGARNIPTPYVELAAVLTFRRFDFLRLVALPAALPSILTGLRNALILAWLATVGAELFLDIAPGLGSRMNEGRDTFQVDLILGSIGLLGLFGTIFSRAAQGAETFLLRRRIAS